MVFVSRTFVETSSMSVLSHSVSFQYGDQWGGTGTVIEAYRMYSNGTWTNLHGDPDEPLIHIQGNTVTGAGTFSHENDLDDTMPGSFTATCNR